MSTKRSKHVQAEELREKQRQADLSVLRAARLWAKKIEAHLVVAHPYEIRLYNAVCEEGRLREALQEVLCLRLRREKDAGLTGFGGVHHGGETA